MFNIILKMNYYFPQVYILILCLQKTCQRQLQYLNQMYRHYLLQSLDSL